MLEDKAIIIIAVSRYAGAYRDLPGAITSARRLRTWAEQADEDCKYKVLYLGDDVYGKIDVRLVRKEVGRFIDSNFIDRLIVYFAGHGIVRSAGEQFWLLTDAAYDTREGINVEAFRRGLFKCNIGGSSNELAGQICIIGDACRNIERDAIDFYGDPILTSSRRMNTRIQLDRFLSTGLGDYSFQIDAIAGQEAYCLFSEVMLGALNGTVKEAVETQYHKFRPAVTNYKLADYLEREVERLAAQIKETMKPDIITGIRPPHNFYRKLREPRTDVTPVLTRRQRAAAARMASLPLASLPSREENIDEPLTIIQERRKKALLSLKKRIELEVRHGSIGFDQNRLEFVMISDFEPDFLAAPRFTDTRVRRLNSRLYQIEVSGSNNRDYRLADCPIVINQGEKWTIVPNYPNVIPVVSRRLPGDVLFLKANHPLWDTYLSDFSNLSGSVPLRAADAQKFADDIRVGKEEFPHQSVTAGYLYEFSGDYDNVARTAHYMARSTRVLPFDLAMLCAERIWWKRSEFRSIAFANIPEVRPFEETSYGSRRPSYARRGFRGLKGIQLWGIAPVFSQGWNFMKTELHLKIPSKIRLMGESVSGRSAASLTDRGIKTFIDFFDYRIDDPEF